MKIYKLFDVAPEHWTGAPAHVVGPVIEALMVACRRIVSITVSRKGLLVQLVGRDERELERRAELLRAVAEGHAYNARVRHEARVRRDYEESSAQRFTEHLTAQLKRWAAEPRAAGQL